MATKLAVQQTEIKEREHSLEDLQANMSIMTESAEELQVGDLYLSVFCSTLCSAIFESTALGSVGFVSYEFYLCQGFKNHLWSFSFHN